MLSVLWILGGPFLLVAFVNRDAARAYTYCIEEERRWDAVLREMGRQKEALARERQAHDRCLEFQAERSLSIDTFFKRTAEAAIGWTVVLLPLFLFWLVGFAALGTVRCICRRWSAGKTNWASGDNRETPAIKLRSSATNIFCSHKACRPLVFLSKRISFVRAPFSMGAINVKS